MHTLFKGHWITYSHCFYVLNEKPQGAEKQKDDSAWLWKEHDQVVSKKVPIFTTLYRACKPPCALQVGNVQIMKKR